MLHLLCATHFAGNMIHEWHTANGSAPTDQYGSVFKNMNQVREFAGVHMDTPVVAVDDRPDNILHGEVRRPHLALL